MIKILLNIGFKNGQHIAALLQIRGLTNPGNSKNVRSLTGGCIGWLMMVVMQARRRASRGSRVRLDRHPALEPDPGEAPDARNDCPGGALR